MKSLREAIEKIRREPTLRNWGIYCIEAGKYHAFDEFRCFYCPFTGCMHLNCDDFYCYLYTQVSALCSEDSQHAVCGGIVACAIDGVKIPYPWGMPDFQFACLCACHFTKTRCE